MKTSNFKVISVGLASVFAFSSAEAFADPEDTIEIIKRASGMADQFIGIVDLNRAEREAEEATERQRQQTLENAANQEMQRILDDSAANPVTDPWSN